jgi:hypothetical protein
VEEQPAGPLAAQPADQLHERPGCR